MTLEIFFPSKMVVGSRIVYTFYNFPILFSIESSNSAFLPNSGRLQELLQPGRIIHLVREENSPNRKTRYTAVAVDREEHPIMLHTHRSNEVARYRRK